ncbi:MAG: hypothetical protein KAH17_10025 [Bacteroidales bacterium]|nr:hypothetical protein [Bacteroidales bacterium]
MCFSITGAFGQGEVADDAQIFYRYERTVAGHLYSNGWGADASFTKRQNAFSSFTYGAGIGVINHPKEYKSQSPYTGGWGRSYVFGKTNEAIALRIAAGYQKELFSKYDKGGIAIRYFYSGGLTLVLLKPIYYQKIVGINYETSEILFKPSLFDPDYMQSIYDIYDRESFFMGLNETTLSPGAFVRAGLSFEYSTSENTITAIEGGVQLEGFLTKLPVMTGNNNNQLLLSLFVSYRVGKVRDN